MIVANRSPFRFDRTSDLFFSVGVVLKFQAIQIFPNGGNNSGEVGYWLNTTKSDNTIQLKILISQAVKLIYKIENNDENYRLATRFSNYVLHTSSLENGSGTFGQKIYIATLFFTTQISHRKKFISWCHRATSSFGRQCMSATKSELRIPSITKASSLWRVWHYNQDCS